MSDEEDTLDLPSLSEATSLLELSADSGIDPLFEGDSIDSSIIVKLAAVEALLNLATKNCKYDDYIREVLLIIIRVIKSEAGSILEVDERNQFVFFRAVVGSASERVTQFKIPMGQGIVGHVLESRCPLVVANIPENKIHLKSIEKAVGFEARNLVAIPILIRGRVYCVLELLNRVGEADFSPKDVEFLTYLCQMAAKAIELRLMIAWAHPRAKPASQSEEK